MREPAGAPRRRLAAALVTVAALLAIPASAQAITVSGTAVPTTTTQAGANSDFEINVNFGGGEDVKDLTVGLPPGATADPTATPKCTADQLATATAGNDGCPANTQVGTVTVNADITIVVVPVNLNVSGKLYNFTPNPGEPARFAIVLQPGDLGGQLMAPLPPVILQSGAELRQTDFGLNSVVNNIPNTTSGLPTHINSQQIVLFGDPAAHGVPGTPKPFARNPTSCSPKVTSFTAVPYSGTTGTGESPPFTPTNCGALPFSPTFSAKAGGPGQTAFGTRGPVSTLIQQDAGEAGLRTAAVITPVDFSPDFYQLDENCQPADFNAGTCPPGTVVGSAVASSPALTEPLTGPVILVKTAGLPNIGLDLKGQLNMRLQGGLGFDNAVTFDGLPDIPISDFQLTFSGGPTSLLTAARDLCKPPAPMFPSRFVAHSGATTSGSTAATIEGCGPVAKCKKAKKKRKKGSKSEAVTAKKKKKKKGCKRKKRKKKRR